MAIRAYCGFGHDLPTTLVGAGASVSTTPRYKHAGNPSLKITYNGADAAYFRMLDMTDGEIKGFDAYAVSRFAISGYLRITSFADCEVLSATDYVAGAMAWSLRLNIGGTLALYDLGGVLLATGETVLLRNTWYYVQLTVNLGATGAYALAIDLVEEFSGTGNFGTDHFNDLRFGVSNTTDSDAATFHWANVSVDDSAVPTTGQRVMVLNLDSAGTYSEWTTGTWEDVCEDPADGDTTVITSSTSGHRLTGDVDLLSEDLPETTTVYGVMCRSMSKSAGPGTMDLRCMIRSGTTDVQTAPNTIGTAWTQSAKLDATDPSTELAWTWAGVQAAEVGVRRSSGSVDGSIVTAVWMEVLIGATDYVIPYAAGVTAMAFISDMHAGGGPYIGHAIRCLQWLQMHGVLPKALCDAGDLNENSEEEIPFHEWIRATDGGDLDTGIEIVVAPGNWDADETPNSTNFGLIAENPYSALKALYPDLFGDNEFGSWDDPGGIVRVAFLNNISDYTNDEGKSAYFNCNPPGAEMGSNPDHSGILTPGSAVRTWLDGVFGTTAPPWRVVLMHRSLYAPYDSDPRKLNREARPAFLTPIDNGLSLIATGDIHVGSLSGPWYPAGGVEGDPTAQYVAPGGTGAYALTLAGGYLPRNVDETVLPNHAETCLWASGGSGTKKVQAALVLFSNEGDNAQIVIFESSDADPLGSIVYNGTLLRNTAGDATAPATIDTYLDPDLVRELCHLLTAEIITDEELQTIALSFADPEIDAALDEFGAPFGFTAPPQIIRTISALLTTAVAFDDRFCQTADESQFAAAKRKDARSLLTRIRNGELRLGVVDEGEPIDVSDSYLEEQPAERTFVGDELSWEAPTELREE